MGASSTKLEGDEFMPSDNYFKERKGPEISQFKPISARQIKNRSGAYVWEVDDMMKLQRFLILGADNAFAYKAGKNEPKRENARCIDRLIGDGKGVEAVELIKNISVSGRAPKQIPTMYALALCARCNDEKTKAAAYEALQAICRIPTHLFLFVRYSEHVGASSGWGRAHKRAIVNWYNNKAKNPKALGRLVTKYKAREGWSHRDLFRLSHIKPDSNGMKLVARFVVNGLDEAKKLADTDMKDDESITKLLAYLEAADKARRCTDEEEMVELIEKYGLEREHLTTQLLHSGKVWGSLIKTLGMTAIVRNLGKMTQLGLVNVGSQMEGQIVEKLTDVKALKEARVHPFNILLAMNTYKKGRGDKGKLTWIPNANVLKGLDTAYYASFQAVEPTGKRYLLAIDVSGSMGVPCVGSNSISCRDAAAAMMMVTARTETNCDIVAFSHKLTPMSIEKTESLNDVVEKSARIPMGGTDCALPMIWAQEKKKTYDVFIVYTDSETWYGKVHPSRALQDYRVNMENPNAKLIVVGMASNGFTIADPDDFGMLDIVGFDSGATETIAKFSVGEV